MICFSQDEWECNLNLTSPPFKLNGLQFRFLLRIALALHAWKTLRLMLACTHLHFARGRAKHVPVSNVLH